MRSELRSGVIELEEASSFLLDFRNRMPEGVIYADHVAAGLLTYFSDEVLERHMRPLDAALPAAPSSVLLVEGGGRGIDLAPGTFHGQLQGFKERLPAGTVLVERFRASSGRGAPLVISEVIRYSFPRAL